MRLLNAVGILFLAIIISCNNITESGKIESADTQSNKVENVKNDSFINKKENFKTEILPHTTLDSLQGTWISLKDTNDCVTISTNQYTESYKGEPDATITSKIFFTDTCVDDTVSVESFSKLDRQKQSDRYMITSSLEDSTDNLCYYIDELNSEYLTLIYHGKTLDFYKKK